MSTVEKPKLVSPVKKTGDHDTDLRSMLKFRKHNNVPENIQKFLNTPFFRNYMSSTDIEDIVGFYTTYCYLSNVSNLGAIWKDIPFDYLQTYKKVLQILEYRALGQPSVQKWMGETISPATFFNMINRHYLKHGISKLETEFNDTFNQVDKLLAKNDKITAPKQWRLTVFHDHVSYLYLKSTVDNKEHNNEFIPEPVNKGKFRIYQPKDTLELATWGSKVRNCVLSYEDRIINKRSAIILIEEEDTPKYTFELEYSALEKGVISVKQATGIANSSIPADQKSTLQAFIQEVIKK